MALGFFRCSQSKTRWRLIGSANFPRSQCLSFFCFFNCRARWGSYSRLVELCRGQESFTTLAPKKIPQELKLRQEGLNREFENKKDIKGHFANIPTYWLVRILSDTKKCILALITFLSDRPLLANLFRPIAKRFFMSWEAAWGEKMSWLLDDLVYFFHSSFFWGGNTIQYIST